MRDRDALAAVLLSSRMVSDGLRPLKASEFWALCDVVGAPGDLLACADDELSTRFGLTPDLAGRITALLRRSTAMAFALDDLDQSGIATVTPFDSQYPQRFAERLGHRAPPILHVAGTPELLDRPGVGIVGSRDVGTEAADAARAIAADAARHGFTLVSGGARGVDQIAMNAAFEAGGSVIGVLADALTRTVRTPDIRSAIHDQRAAMMTPYGPDARFSAGNAMGRNKLVYALATLTVVIASDSGSGGTWTGATEALKEGYGRVAVWRGAGEGPGNALLEQRGAHPISSPSDVDRLLAAPETSPVSAATRQPSLFDAG